MQEALRAQQSGRGREAMAGYRRVLAADPSNFDAAHMLALVEYEYGRYESAIELLRRAIELRPDLGGPRHNLRLLESMPRIEEGICRDILPRLASRIEPVSDVARFAPRAAPVHLVQTGDARGEEAEALERLRAAFGARRPEVWAAPGIESAAPGPRALAPQAGAHPVGGLIALFGASRSQAAWLGAARPERVLLVAVRDEPCAVVDRIDEVALLCDARPGVVCATRALAERLGLPRSAALADARPGTAATP